MLPFWVSIVLLSVTQGVVVGFPRAWYPARLRRLHSRLWAAVPAGSVIAFVAVARLAERDSARLLTYVALVAVPLLAALAMGWLMWGARPSVALLAVGLFALAWVDRGGLAGEGAAVALSALSAVALGVLIAGVTPVRWLALGILAMAAADTALVVSDLLQRPNEVLNAAHPAGGLPRLQAAVFGSAVMGYGDLFVAGVLGGLLAVVGDRSRQLTAALLVAVLAVAFDLLFFAVNELPATVPVAVALLILLLADRRRGVSRVRGTRVPAVGAGPLRRCRAERSSCRP